MSRVENCNLALIAIGANLAGHLDSPYAQLHAAISDISKSGQEVVAVSRFFRTPCFPAGAGPDFVNAALSLRTKMEAGDLLRLLHGIERARGRSRSERWEARVIDLDLLAMGDLVLPDQATYLAWSDLPLEDQKRSAPDDLILPHPRLHERAFVLVPLQDIAPDWRHPVRGETVAEMCASLPEATRAEIWPLPAPMSR